MIITPAFMGFRAEYRERIEKAKLQYYEPVAERIGTGSVQRLLFVEFKSRRKTDYRIIVDKANNVRYVLSELGLPRLAGGCGTLDKPNWQVLLERYEDWLRCVVKHTKRELHEGDPC